MYRAFILSTLALPTFVLSHIHYQHPAIPELPPIVIRHHTPPPAPQPAPKQAPEHTTSPVEVPSVPETTNTSSLCMNYGYQPLINGKYDLTANGEVERNVNAIESAGITCVRVAYMGWSNPASELLAVYLKSRGDYVIIGGDWGNLTNSQIGSYDQQVLQEAKWAEQIHIDQLSLGNEQEYRLSGITRAEWASHLSDLAAKVKQVYHGTVSYETSADFESDWKAAGRGNIDLLGFNTYPDKSNSIPVSTTVQNMINDFGKGHVYLSEFNVDMGTGNYENDATHAQYLKTFYDSIKGMGIPIYYFAFNSGGNGVPLHWGLFNGATLVQPLTATVLGIQ